MRLIFFFFTLLFCCDLLAQDSAIVSNATDSVSMKPALPAMPDTMIRVDAVPSFDFCRTAFLKDRVKLNLLSKPEFLIEKEKQRIPKEWLFYYILSLSLLFGLLKVGYQRYFKDLFRVFFKTSLRVNQIREQLVQSGLQSLLFNIFFSLAAGIYVYLLAVHFNVSVQLPELFIPLLTSALIALLYLGKYIFLRFSGWLFSMRNAAEAYSFIVFLINKIIGVVLLPFIIIIAFAKEPLVEISITASLAIITALFLYRFLRAYNPIQADLKLGRFHFFIFFLAFEIAPLLVIYRVFLNFM